MIAAVTATGQESKMDAAWVSQFVAHFPDILMLTPTMVYPQQLIRNVYSENSDGHVIYDEEEEPVYEVPTYKELANEEEQLTMMNKWAATVHTTSTTKGTLVGVWHSYGCNCQIH